VINPSINNLIELTKNIIEKCKDDAFNDQLKVSEIENFIDIVTPSLGQIANCADQQGEGEGRRFTKLLKDFCEICKICKIEITPGRAPSRIHVFVNSMLPEPQLLDLILETAIDFIPNKSIHSLAITGKRRRSTAQKEIVYRLNQMGLFSDLKIGLNQINSPEKVKMLNLCACNITGFDFSKFTELKEIDLSYILWSSKSPTPKQFGQISSRVKILNLNGSCITDFDFSKFIELEKIFFANSWPTPKQFEQISSRLKGLYLSNSSTLFSSCNVAYFDFSKFTELEEINFQCVKDLSLTSKQFGQISSRVKILDLPNCNVADFDFSKFAELERINLKSTYGLTPEQFRQISSRVKILDLSDRNVADFNFSKFAELEKISLSGSHLTSEQFGQISSRVKILNLSGCILSGRNLPGYYVFGDFNFSKFAELEEINLCRSHLTSEQFGQISPRVKILNLSDCNVANFNFSKFAELEEINLHHVSGLTPEQFGQISSLVKTLDLSDCDVAGFDFARFSKLEQANFKKSRGWTLEQKNTLNRRIQWLVDWL